MWGHCASGSGVRWPCGSACHRTGRRRRDGGGRAARDAGARRDDERRRAARSGGGTGHRGDERDDAPARAGIFVTEDLGALTLRGVPEPVPAHRVVQPSGVRSRLDVAAGRLTRFVGREVELATLVERWERAADGEGQNVLVVGEAGVGKSRLAYQLRERLATIPHTWLECGASPYTEGRRSTR